MGEVIVLLAGNTTSILKDNDGALHNASQSKHYHIKKLWNMELKLSCLKFLLPNKFGIYLPQYN